MSNCLISKRVARTNDSLPRVVTVPLPFLSPHHYINHSSPPHFFIHVISPEGLPKFFQSFFQMIFRRFQGDFLRSFVLLFKAVLLDRPRVISEKVGHAWDLPSNTFGAAYASFMGSRNFSPDDRPPVRFMETEELAYVAIRAREVHDFWHTLFGLPTNLIGETALKVIEFEQMLLPMCLMSVLGGTSRFSEKQRSLFCQDYFPWAIRAGMKSTDLMSIYYEKHFDEDLKDVRKRWGIISAPQPHAA